MLLQRGRHLLTAALGRALVSTTLCLLFAPRVVAQSLPFQFPPATPVNGGAFGPQSHAVATAADGTIYVAYDLRAKISPKELRTVFVARSTDGGKTWKNVAIASGATRWPRIAVARSGDVNLVYLVYLDGDDCIGGGITACKSTPDRPVVKFVRLVDGETIDSFASLSTPGATRVSEPDVAVGASGRVYVTWSEGGTDLDPALPSDVISTYLLQLRTSVDGFTFSDPLTIRTGRIFQIVPFPGAKPRDVRESFSSPRIAVSGRGRIHTLYSEDYAAGSLNYSQSTDGTSFTTQVLSSGFSVVTAAGGNHALAVDRRGNASVVFQDSGAIEYVRIAGGGVGSPVTIASGKNVTDPNVAVDRLGATVVVYSAPGANKLFNEVFFRMSPSNPVVFGPPTNMSQTARSQSYEPAVVIDRNTIPLVVWGEGSGGQTLFRMASLCVDVDGNGTPDNDGDGLCDDWERDGIRDLDGNVVLDLPAMGADPNHKDVFVQVDYMDCGQGGCAAGDLHSHRPSGPALAAVVQAFRNAPVENPDGKEGINLHFVGSADDPRGQALPEVPSIHFDERGPGPADDFDDLKNGSNDPANTGQPCGTGPFDGHFGTVADRTASNCEQILEAKRRAFRYVIFGHDQADKPGSSGRAEDGGNDFVVTLGSFRDTVRAAAMLWNTTFGQEWDDAEAGTLMHELGHALGLDHGGLDDVNCKPNYLSVMRYGRQFNEWGPASDLPGIADGTRVRLNRPLDYSRAELPVLDEDASVGGLDETKGIQGPAGQRMLFGVGGARRVGPSVGAVNWNGNADAAEVGIGADVNFINDEKDCPASPNQSLAVQNDWLSLVYDFRQSPDYADGETRLTLSKAEQTATEYARGVLGDWDFDGDGIPNMLDNCPTIPNPSQADGDGNGIGDVCERPADDTPPAITASLSSEPNAAGWHRQPVTVTWTLADPESSIAASTGCDPVTVAVETAGLTLTCSATNGAGLSASKSVVIKLDTTPPQVSGSRTPAANSSGWNNGDVSVAFTCEDALSGVASCTPATLVLTAEGRGQSVTATAVDQAGNSASATIGGINIDKTAPTLACSASPKALWPANHKMVAVQAAVSVNDALSGPGGFVLVSAASNEPDDGLGDGDTANDIQDFVIGTPDLAGLVRAERSGRGAGRTYSLSYRGWDAAGNPGTCTTAVSVPHDRGH
jgi:hypothetical protein